MMTNIPVQTMSTQPVGISHPNILSPEENESIEHLLGVQKVHKDEVLRTYRENFKSVYDKFSSKDLKVFIDIGTGNKFEVFEWKINESFEILNNLVMTSGGVELKIVPIPSYMEYFNKTSAWRRMIEYIPINYSTSDVIRKVEFKDYEGKDHTEERIEWNLERYFFEKLKEIKKELMNDYDDPHIQDCIIHFSSLELVRQWKEMFNNEPSNK